MQEEEEKKFSRQKETCWLGTLEVVFSPTFLLFLSLTQTCLGLYSLVYISTCSKDEVGRVPRKKVALSFTHVVVGGKKKGTHFMPKMDGQKKKKTQSSHRFIHQDATYIAKISLVFLLPAHLSCNVLYTFYLMVHFVYYTDLANDAAQPDDRPLKTGLTFPILLPCASFSILIRRL